MSWPIVLDAVEQMDMTLLSDLSWAGGRFPFAGSQDITISANTTWSDAVGFKKVKKLTIAAGVVLKIKKSPFYLFADEIQFGSTGSSISIDGNSGNDAVGRFSALGGRSGDQLVGAGDGGGLLIVCARTISGAAGKITANGGNAYWDGNFAQDYGRGAFNNTGHPLLALAAGLDGAVASNAFSAGGGIGSGGNSTAAGQAARPLTPKQVLELARWGHQGGGGGACRYSYTPNGAGGGGGGAVLVFAKQLSATPVLEANGGNPAPGSGNGYPGGAGLTHLVTL